MSPTEETRKQIWAGAALLIVLQLGYMLIWWNKGIQLNSNGLGQMAALDILAGKAPISTFITGARRGTCWCIQR